MKTTVCANDNYTWKSTVWHYGCSNKLHSHAFTLQWNITCSCEFLFLLLVGLPFSGHSVA